MIFTPARAAALALATCATLALGPVGCVGASDPIEDPNAGRTAGYRYIVDYRPPDVPKTTRILGGMQGSPAPVVEGDGSLVEAYQRNHINFVRLPQDLFCDYSLEGIFPDRSKPASDPASYRFSNIDRLVRGAVQAGAQILWQASYDIGSDQPCRVAEGRHAGRPIQDASKHAEVVVNMLRHFNDGTDWDPNGHTFGVRHVEFVNDPMGLGGYNPSEPQPYFDDYEVFAQGLKAAFPDRADGNPRLRLVAPAHRVRTVSETVAPQGAGRKGFLLQFIDHVAGTGLPLDVLSLQIRLDDPWEMAVAVDNVRNYMDRVGLTDVPIWVTEVAPGLATEERLLRGDPLLHAAYTGAHLAAAKIGWQETVEQVFAHRGPRRFDRAEGGEIIDSAFFSDDGADRLGILPFTAQLIMREKTVLAGSAVTSDGHALLAARDGAADKIWLLHANPADAEIDEPARLVVELRNLPADAELLQWKYAFVGVASVGPFQFSSAGELAVNDGVAVLDQPVPTPATAYIEITW